MAYINQSSVEQMLKKGYSMRKICKTLMVSDSFLKKKIVEWGYEDLVEKNARYAQLNNPMANSSRVRYKADMKTKAKRKYGGFDDCM